MKKLYLVIILLFIQSYAFASYYVPDVDKECKLESYNKLTDFIKKCGVNERIANEKVFLDKKFTGKYPTPLYVAVVFNDLNMVKKLVSAGADVNAVNYFPESSALMKAVENNNIEMVKFLLENGADVNLATPKFNLTAIDFAANYNMASILLSYNAKVDKINGYTFYTPLQKAILLNDMQMIKAYLPKSNIYQKEYLFKKDALYYAVSKRNIDAVKLLIEAGAKITPAEYETYKNMVSNENILNMLSTIIDKDKKEVKLWEDVSAAILYDKVKSHHYSLLDKFTDIYETDDYYALINPSGNGLSINEYEPYRMKVKSLNFPIFEEVTGFDLNDDEDYDDYEESEGYEESENDEPYLMYFPITAAVTYNDIELVQAMLDANHLKLQYPIEYHTSLFSTAVFNGNIDMIKLLMKYNYPAVNCAPPIYNNENEDYSCTNLLVDILGNYEGYDSESQEVEKYKKMYEMFVDYESEIYIHYLNSYLRDENNSIILREDEILEMIYLKPVGLLNNTNDAAEGLLHIAFRKHYDRLASYLIINGFDIFDNYYRVPLEYTNNNKYIEQLLIMGENMYLGELPAAFVFKNAGNIEKLKLFLKYGLDVNVRNQNNKPLLFAAVENKCLDCVKLLIDYGANLDDLYTGANIMQYAKSFGSQEIVTYIKSQIKDKKISLKDDELFDYIMAHYDECKFRNFYSGYQESSNINDIIRSFRYYEKNQCEKSKLEKRAPDEVTPLLYALLLDDDKLIKLLLEKGADPNLIIDDKYINTGHFSLALSIGNEKIIKQFIERNVKLPKRQLKGLLFSNKGDLLEKYNLISSDDIPLVQLAACSNNSKYLKTALKSIDISKIKNWNNNTDEYFDASRVGDYIPNPLECAITYNLADNIKLLLESGIYIKYDNEFNGLSFAKEKNAESKIIEMLETYCANNKDKCN